MARNGTVTVVGAGYYGSTTAQRLAEYDVFDKVVLTDIKDGWAEGLALDLNQSRPIEGFETQVVGRTTGTDGSGYEVIEGSDVVVITAGLPRKPGMSRMDLLGVNAGIVRGVAENVARYAPAAVVIVVSNPLDEMTTLAQVATGFPHARVIGQAGMLDTARFTNSVAEKLAVPVSTVRTLTLGSHGDTMVPVPSACTVSGRPLTDLLDAGTIDELVARTRNGGAEVPPRVDGRSLDYSKMEVQPGDENPSKFSFTDPGITASILRTSVVSSCGWALGILDIKVSRTPFKRPQQNTSFGVDTRIQ